MKRSDNKTKLPYDEDQSDHDKQVSLRRAW